MKLPYTSLYERPPRAEILLTRQERARLRSGHSYVFVGENGQDLVNKVLAFRSKQDKLSAQVEWSYDKFHGLRAELTLFGTAWVVEEKPPPYCHHEFEPWLRWLHYAIEAASRKLALAVFEWLANGSPEKWVPA